MWLEKIWFVKVKKIVSIQPVIRIDYECPVNGSSLLDLMETWAADLHQNPCVLDAEMATRLHDWIHSDTLNRLPRIGIKEAGHIYDDCDPEIHGFMPFSPPGAPWLDCILKTEKYYESNELFKSYVSYRT